MRVNGVDIKENRIILVTGKNSSMFTNAVSSLKDSYLVNDNSIYDIKKENIYEEYLSNLIEKGVQEDIIEKRINEVTKMLSIDEEVLYRNIDNLSSSEITKFLIGKLLLSNERILIIDNLIENLDYSSRTKLFKIILKLKKYYNKTIIINTNNIDLVYECIDDVIYLSDNGIYKYDNKFNLYKEKNISYKPSIIRIVDKIKVKYKNVEYKDSINELIKELYREIR